MIWKKVLLVVVLAIAAGCTKKEEPASLPPTVEIAAPTAPVVSKNVFKVFPVYTDKSSPDNHFAPSGWMGDHADVKLEDASSEKPHSGATCIKITYGSKATGGARWAGIYWQYPPNNWGNLDRFYDLSGARKLTFWIRGEKGGESIQEVKMGGISGQFSDSDTAGVGPLTLTNEWKQYEIDLSGKDLSHIIGGFVWSTNIDANPEGLVFYLDDIKYE